MIRRIMLVIGLALLSYAACDRHANAASLYCDRAALIHAEAEASSAERVQRACFAPDTCKLARELVKAAVEQAKAARMLCTQDVDNSSPFEQE